MFKLSTFERPLFLKLQTWFKSIPMFSHYQLFPDEVEANLLTQSITF